MAKELLDLHVQLLVLQYGRTRVVSSLAHLNHVSEEVLEKELASLSSAKASRPSKAKPTAEELLSRLQLPRETHETIAQIIREFENKRFLGELRLVEKFLVTHGMHKAPRNRGDALPKVLSILANLPIAELKEILSKSSDASSGSEYSHLAGAIMNIRHGDHNQNKARTP